VLKLFTTNRREPIDGLNFIQFGYVDVPKQFWVSDLSFSRIGTKETVVKFDRSAFGGLVVSLPAEGEYAVIAALRRKKIRLGPLDGSATFTAEPGKGFFANATVGSPDGL
jgi:hypothetical protein